MKKQGIIVFFTFWIVLLLASCVENEKVDDITTVPLVKQSTLEPQPELQATPTPQSKVGQEPQNILPTPKLKKDSTQLIKPESTQPMLEKEPILPLSEQPEPTSPPIQVEITPEEVSTPSQPGISLEEKIGQMLIVGFRGLSVNDKHPIVLNIKKFHLGGVILFDYDIVQKSSKRNIRSPQQVKNLVKQLQKASKTLLFIAIDQEGGKIKRLKPKFGFPRTVSAQYLGKKNDLTLTYQHAASMAKTLANLGINFNFAPVVDLNTNPNNPVIGKLERSFSDNPHLVTDHAFKFIEAHHKYGVLCILKHFPGHGSSTNDSHLGLVDVTNTWQKMELEPYANLIQKNMVDAIMTAHVFNRRYDPDYPATLSSRIVTGILRNNLKYDGVIVSDDMQMKAITNHYRFENAIEATLQAGIDIIVIGNNLKYEKDIAARTVAIIKRLVENGKITQARINQSYERIQKLKRWL